MYKDLLSEPSDYWLLSNESDFAIVVNLAPWVNPRTNKNMDRLMSERVASWLNTFIVLNQSLETTDRVPLSMELLASNMTEILQYLVTIWISKVVFDTNSLWFYFTALALSKASPESPRPESIILTWTTPVVLTEELKTAIPDYIRDHWIVIEEGFLNEIPYWILGMEELIKRSWIDAMHLFYNTNDQQVSPSQKNSLSFWWESNNKFKGTGIKKFITMYNGSLDKNGHQLDWFYHNVEAALKKYYN